MRATLTTTLAVLAALASLDAAAVGAPRRVGARPLCADAIALLKGDATLSRAMDVAFPDAAQGDEGVGCTYPFKVLHYDDADVLLTLGAKPGATCSRCGGSLSAYVLDRSPSSRTVVSSYLHVGDYGVKGDPGDAESTTLNGLDAIALDSAGTYGGRGAFILRFLAFRDGRLEPVEVAGDARGKPLPGIPLEAGNGDVDVRATWRVGRERPSVVTVDYTVTKGGKSRGQSTSWRLMDRTLVRLDGSVPAWFSERR